MPLIQLPPFSSIFELFITKKGSLPKILEKKCTLYEKKVFNNFFDIKKKIFFFQQNLAALFKLPPQAMAWNGLVVNPALLTAKTIIKTIIIIITIVKTIIAKITIMICMKSESCPPPLQIPIDKN